MTESVLQYLDLHPEFLMLAVFSIALLESLAIVGIALPGVGLLAAMSVLAGQLQLAIHWLLLSATLGAIIGDSLSFWIGKLFQDRIKYIWPFTSHPNWIEDGHLFFEKYGGISIFFGRFIGPLRPIIPLVAGMMKMNRLTFFKWNVISATLWAPAYLLPGYLLGEILNIHWLVSWKGLTVLTLMTLIAILTTMLLKQHKINKKKPD